MKKIIFLFFIFFSPAIHSLAVSSNIVYVSEPGGISNLSSYDTTSAITERITNFQDAGNITSISANQAGNAIVFTRPSAANGRTNSTVWSISADGSSFCDLIEGETDIDFRYAAISPDGTQIVYSKNSLGNPDTYHLYLKTAAETRLLTSSIGYSVECAYPIFLNEDTIIFLLVDIVHGRYDYYRVNTDGTGLTNLTNNNSQSPYFPRLGRPSINDAKTAIIYGKQVQTPQEFSEWQIYTLNLASGSEQLIFNNLYYTGILPENQPDPQPFFKDGAEIGLAGTTNSIDFDLYFTNIDSEIPYLQRVTYLQSPRLPYYFTTQAPAEQWLYEIGGQVRIRDENGMENYIAAGISPAFNWSGTYAAFSNSGIKIRRLGSTTSSSVETDATADCPAFSPDNRWIAYVKNNDIWARLLDMSNSPRQLTNSPLTGKQDISFSPDARHILFTGMENGKKYVYRMPLSITYGTAPLINSAGLPVKLTAGTNDNYNPAFSPDGDAVAFISTRNQAPELWMMNADGTNQRKIIFASSVPVNPAFPQFSPCDSSIIAYLSGTPSRIYTVDISQEFKSGIEISPALTTTGRFSWAKSPSGNIEIERHKVFGTYYPDIPLEYNISVAINRKQMPASFLVEETVPETWILTDVKINGTAPPSTEITSWGDRKTMRWLFGGGGIAVGDSVIELAFALNGDTVGNSYWLTGGATVSDRKYLTAGDSHMTIGEPCMPVDSDENWLIDDFELLNSIDMWAQNIQVKGWPADTEDWDFWLLSIINFWANNNGYRYKTGGTQPDWEPVP